MFVLFLNPFISAFLFCRYKSNSAQLLVEARVQPSPSKHVSVSHLSKASPDTHGSCCGLWC